jgi:hypothetical protein
MAAVEGLASIMLLTAHYSVAEREMVYEQHRDLDTKSLDFYKVGIRIWPGRPVTADPTANEARWDAPLN